MIMNIPFFQNHTTHTHTKTGTIKEQMMNPAWINSNQDRKLFYREVMRRGRKWTISDMPLREISYDATPLPTPAVQMDGRSKTFLSCCLLFSERRMSNRTPWCLTTTPKINKKKPPKKHPLWITWNFHSTSPLSSTFLVFMPAALNILNNHFPPILLAEFEDTPFPKNSAWLF